MTLIILLTAAVALVIGYLAALALNRSRIELARSEARAGAERELVESGARIRHQAEELLALAIRLKDADAALESARGAHGLASQEAARLQAQVEALRREEEALFSRLKIETGQKVAAEDLVRSLSGEAASLRAQVDAGVAQAADLATRLGQANGSATKAETAIAESLKATATVQALAAELQATLEAREKELSGLRQEAIERDAALTTLRAEFGAKAEEAASLTAQIQGFHDTSAARIETLQEAQKKLGETFQSLSAEALKANSESFLQLAGTQMQGNRTESSQDLLARQVAIENLLKPVQTNLTAMQNQVQALAASRSAADATLTSQIATLAQSQAGLQAETGKLANALRKPEVKGQWGEVQLRNVIEYAGMKEHVDFDLQSSLEVGDDKRRPDLIVKLPGNKRISVDAKVPLRAYLEALEVEGPAREERLDAVASQVRAQVKSLGDKRYYDGLTESPDFVVLFLPLEALFSMALERDSHLLDFALQQNVILASPTTLIALLKSAAYGWAQERIQANAEEIQKLGSELLNRVMLMAVHTDVLRKAILASVEAFNGFAGSLERGVLVTGDKLRLLGIQTTRKKLRKLGFQPPPAIHENPRGLPKLGVQGEAPIIDVDTMDSSEGPDFEGEELD